MRACAPFIGLLLATAPLTGCVERTISITSDPPGALVWLNDREIGRTPVETEFLYYGTYDVRIVKDGYVPLQTFGEANPPWWDLPGPDLLAEAVPNAESRIEWHYDLEAYEAGVDALIDNARQAEAAFTEAVTEEPGG